MLPRMRGINASRERGPSRSTSTPKARPPHYDGARPALGDPLPRPTGPCTGNGIGHVLIYYPETRLAEN